MYALHLDFLPDRHFAFVFSSFRNKCRRVKLETAKSFLTSAKKLLLEVPRAAPQHQLYQTVPSELQPFTFYLGDKKILVAKFSAVKKYICHQKLE